MDGGRAEAAVILCGDENVGYAGAGVAMDLEDLEASATPAEMAAALEEHHDVLHVLQHAHAQEPSVREETHRGHRIKVVTTYEITIDGRPVSGHLNIGNNGAVHYHAIPNQEFPSMIGMVKRIIDLSIDLGTVDSGGQDHGGGDQDPGRIERWPG